MEPKANSPTPEISTAPKSAESSSSPSSPNANPPTTEISTPKSTELSSSPSSPNANPPTNEISIPELTDLLSSPSFPENLLKLIEEQPKVTGEDNPENFEKYLSLIEGGFEVAGRDDPEIFLRCLFLFAKRFKVVGGDDPEKLGKYTSLYSKVACDVDGLIFIEGAGPPPSFEFEINSENCHEIIIPAWQAKCAVCTGVFSRNQVIKRGCKCKFTLVHCGCLTQTFQQKIKKCDVCKEEIRPVPMTLCRDKLPPIQGTEKLKNQKWERLKKSVRGCFGYDNQPMDSENGEDTEIIYVRSN